MEEQLFDRPGEILGLAAALDGEHGEAIEYELLALRYRVSDLDRGRLDWREFSVLLNRWQLLPGSALADSIAGAETWPVRDQLLAHAVDLLANANWQRAKAGTRRSVPRPKPVPRPWEKPKSQRLGSGAIPAASFDDWWDSVGATVRKERAAGGV